MPLAKIHFAPGIVTETTNYTASGGWYMCDKMRFRAGMPEKIGGWTQVVSQPFEGACRYLHQWSNNEGNQQYIGLGTSSKLYILWSQSYHDITPVRATIALGASNPFCTLGPGSTQLRIYAPNNGARIGDFFRISGATAFDVFTEDMLNREFQVVGFYNEDEDYLVVTAPAVTPSAGTVCGGNDNGTASAEFDISSGLESAVVGKGWGIPPW